jgi:hypothetical protein
MMEDLKRAIEANATHKVIQLALKADPESQRLSFDYLYSKIDSCSFNVLSCLLHLLTKSSSINVPNSMLRTALLIVNSDKNWDSRVIGGLLAACMAKSTPEILASKSPAFGDALLWLQCMQNAESRAILIGGVLCTFSADYLSCFFGGCQVMLSYFDDLFVMLNQSSSPLLDTILLKSLARWFTMVTELVVGDSAYSSEISMLLLNRDNVFSWTVSCVQAKWDDPLDVIQHKLRDLFSSCLKLMVAISHETNEHIVSLTKNLLVADPLRKVKYESLSLLLKYSSAQLLYDLCPSLISKCFQLQRHSYLSSSIVTFITRFFAHMKMEKVFHCDVV